jgi:glutamate/tyrosine decarboxylase-like PLP-dependent enzyme
MNWDLTMPGMLGYFAAMLYNQNNVALEASPVTAQLEQEVGKDLCKMLGFDTSEDNPTPPWGHVTCDGSVANLEAMWAARNLKYYPLSERTTSSTSPSIWRRGWPCVCPNSGSSECLETALNRCLAKKQLVVMVVVVLGSTEESAVDPLAEVIALRDEFRPKGLDFAIHVDGAWGGYFASILRGESGVLTAGSTDLGEQVTPILEMSDYVTRQYEFIPQADSVTIDPHKAGYIPYPAGGMCYRNSAMRNLVAFLAPEVYHGSDPDANMGVYGVEGSKPGAAPAAVYLSHRIIRPDKSGYGKVLGQALFNSKRLYSAIMTMAEEQDDFIVVPVQQIPAEREGKSPEEIRRQMEFIKARIAAVQNNELIQDTGAMNLLRELGSDQIIITSA